MNPDNQRDDYQWCHVSGGLLRHALPHPGARGAVCGVYVAAAGGWHPTGTPAEYDTITTLPQCLLCLAIIGEGARTVTAQRGRHHHE